MKRGHEVKGRIEEWIRRLMLMDVESVQYSTVQYSTCMATSIFNLERKIVNFDVCFVYNDTC